MSLASALGIGYKEALLMEIAVVNEMAETRFGERKKEA